MPALRRVIAIMVTALAVFASLSPAEAQDRARTKEIVVGLGAEPRTLLAVTIVDWTTANMIEHVYDRLLDRDAKTFKPKPMLATSWKIVNDTTWEFTLRQGVKFHNGEPFTAASVKATIDYALDPASKSHYASASYWGPVKEVQVVDDLWFEHAVEAQVLGMPVELMPCEELIWQKAFILERDRCLKTLELCAERVIPRFR